ncbi:helix-turn-helix domain-containing protein [Leuconostoc lactis]|uniref:Helix-turn-helix domain-containing protein n=2 Tax=Leuconostoc TaxID=1243 RepID=A0AAP9J9Y0_LEULA|nr:MULTISPECIES: helix-turn-helix transcriptional regulator [Leuconostoc]AQN79273.1 transcriptional regulator [Leuconostoc garlicum]KQB80835.1 transcriptional regulator [Leuconostoc lactis]MCC2744751.1 helix-turn-helix domain-containing protein [Leuconostoc lactis]MCC2755246.1 helix-turn-helix domain-containing protein [Leuconostoc lactis]MDN2649125.1 helix-turn-helix domain-containing protein [Leuconostoc lactis]
MSVTSERMKEQRKIKKLTQTSLAELVNSSRSSIAQIETDKYTPSFAMLSLIADALDTTVEYLQGKTDNALKTTLNGSTDGDTKVKHVDLADDELIMSFEGKELSEEYKQAIIATLRTMREGKK